MFDWLDRRRYLFLLLSLGALFVLHPLTIDLRLFGRWFYDLLATAVFLACFQLVFHRHGRRWLVLLLGGTTLLANWTGYAIPGIPPLPLALAFHAQAVVFLAVIVLTILQGIREAKTVSTDSLFGAFSGYLLVGLIFCHLYCIIQGLSPWSFRGDQGPLPQMGDPDVQVSVLSYYSFITLTTVGYGDIVPVSHMARTLACLEAVVGQFYIAVLMAELIGLKASQMSSGPADPSG